MFRLLKLILRQKKPNPKVQQDISYLIGAYRDGTPEFREQLEQVILEWSDRFGDDWVEKQVERLRKL